YEFGFFDYLSDKPLTADVNSLRGTDRDNRSHYVYVGAEHAFSSQLNGLAKVGVEYTDYVFLKGSEWNPFVELRGTYTYLPGSYVQFGLTHRRNATDVTGAGTEADIVRDQESTTFFASVNHRLTPQVTGSLLGQFQRSSYTGGTLDGKV